MVPEDDWRLCFAGHLKDARFRWKQWYPPSESWDHDHCLGCWATFNLNEGGDSLQEGYAITADYQWGADYVWVCPACFEDLNENLNWSVALNESPSGPIPAAGPAI